MNSVVIPSPTSVEKLRAVITTPSDPTAGTVSFQLTAVGAMPTSGGWTAGGWAGTYSGGKATATSPLIASLSAAAGQMYDVWVRWTVGSETPERLVGRLTIGA